MAHLATPSLSAGAANKGARARSTVEFPYSALDDAEAFAKGVRDVGATSCEWDQLAAHLGFAANGGGFRLRMISAKVFSLLTYERGKVELTDIGIRIVDPKFTRSARVEAFLAVPLYRSAYEKLRGQTLPPSAAIERLLETLGVAPKQKDKARQAFMRSAKHAGFFEIAPDRLTLPPSLTSHDVSESAKTEDTQALSSSGNRSKVVSDDMHAFIRGLLEKLPDPESDWPLSGRVKWLQTAANIFDLMYANSGDTDASIEVKQVRD